MKRITYIVLTTLIMNSLSSQLSYANVSKKLRVTNQIEISFPSVFKLTKSGCKAMTFKYKLSKNFDVDSTISLYVEDDIYRYVAYEVWDGYELYEAANPKTLQGNSKIEFCRDSYYDSSLDLDIYPSYKGNHRITLALENDEYKEVSTLLRLSE